eukprot:1161712-Pelagomonas_calceolata.AAC.17
MLMVFVWAYFCVKTAAEAAQALCEKLVEAPSTLPKYSMMGDNDWHKLLYLPANYLTEPLVLPPPQKADSSSSEIERGGSDAERQCLSNVHVIWLGWFSFKGTHDRKMVYVLQEVNAGMGAGATPKARVGVLPPKYALSYRERLTPRIYQPKSLNSFIATLVSHVQPQGPSRRTYLVPLPVLEPLVTEVSKPAEVFLGGTFGMLESHLWRCKESTSASLQFISSSTEHRKRCINTRAHGSFLSKRFPKVHDLCGRCVHATMHPQNKLKQASEACFRLAASLVHEPPQEPQEPEGPIRPLPSFFSELEGSQRFSEDLLGASFSSWQGASQGASLGASSTPDVVPVSVCSFLPSQIKHALPSTLGCDAGALGWLECAGVSCWVEPFKDGAGESSSAAHNFRCPSADVAQACDLAGLEVEPPLLPGRADGLQVLFFSQFASIGQVAENAVKLCLQARAYSQLLALAIQWLQRPSFLGQMLPPLLM